MEDKNNRTELKQCTKCKETYSETTEFFYKQKKQDGTYKLTSWCKECTKKKSNEYQKENRSKISEYKRCFRKENNKIVTERVRKWNNEHKENIKNNLKRWQENNKDKLKEYNNKRRKKNHIISHKEWNACKNYFHNCCAYCGMTHEEHKIKYKQDLHKEHVIHDGSVYLDNCVPSCKVCNSNKSEYTLDEWYNENNLIYTYERLNKIHKWLENDYKLYFQGYREKRTRNKQ